jgi:hypothetical protein
MPGHFTHIYAARRVADWLAQQQSFNADDNLDEGGQPLTGGLDGLDLPRAAKVMTDWPKYTNLGAIGPDIFFFCQDYGSGPLAAAPYEDDVLMLAMGIYYWIDTASEEDWEPLLILLAEVDQTFARIVRLLIKLKKLWDSFVAGWNATIGPFVDAVGNLLDGLTGGILSQAAVVFQELFDGLKQIAEEELLTFADIFSWFALKMRAGWDEKSFVWSDMLHYRKTNQMARNLFAEAKRQFDIDKNQDKFAQFQAFALGWICHVGTDVIGHCFVNEQCGGPFRTHWQRHHLVENHIDSLNFRQAGPGGTITTDNSIGATDTYTDLGQGALVFAVALEPDTPNGKERPPTLPDDQTAADKAVDTDGDMPDWLAEGIVRALIATYHDGGPEPQNLGGSEFQNGINTFMSVLEQVLNDAGVNINMPLNQAVQQIAPAPSFNVPKGYPLPWEVKVTYKFMLTYYKFAFWGGFDLAKPKRPDVIIWPPASDFSNLASPPDFSGVNSSDPIEDICDAILAIFEWFFKELAAGLQLIGDLIKAVTSPFTYPIRYGLYQLAMYFWDMVTTTHEILAHTGFVLPHGDRDYDDGELMYPNEIDQGLVSLGNSTDQAFLQALADATDPFGNLDRDPALIDPPHNPRTLQYPFLPVRDAQTPGGEVNEFRRPWAYPDHSRNTHGDLYPTPMETSDIWAELDYVGRGRDLELIMRAGVLAKAGTVSGPFPAGSTPDQVLFRTGRQVNPNERAHYEVAPTPAHTDALNEVLIGRAPDTDHSPLGDPIQFCTYLMGRILSPEGYGVDFNLDADRGYGYRCWDWIRGDGTGTNGRNQPYPLPVVPPEGADSGPAPVWQGAPPDVPNEQPLQLRYLDGKDAPVPVPKAPIPGIAGFPTPTGTTGTRVVTGTKSPPVPRSRLVATPGKHTSRPRGTRKPTPTKRGH